MLTIGDMLTRDVRLYPQKSALIFRERKYSYQWLNERANRLANAVIGLGVGKGQRVAILLRNSNEYVEVYFGLAKSGAIAVPLNYRLTGPDLADLINDCEATVLIIGDEYARVIETIRGRLQHVENCILVGKEGGSWNYASLLAAASPREPNVGLGKDDVVYIVYTAGTTGRSKGVMLSHRNLITHSLSADLELKLGPEAVFLNAAPICHLAGLNRLLNTMLVGATYLLLPEFEPEHILRAIETERATHALFVPTMIALLLQFPEFRRYDLSSLRTIYYGAAPIPVEQLKQAMDSFGCGFLQAYGQTESSAVSFLRPEEHVVSGPAEVVGRIRSAGREALGTRVKLVDDKDNEVPMGEVGEVVATGDNIMKGYWKLPEESAQGLRGGWLHTGDLARMDEDGYIYIVDRKRDMIKSGGLWVYPKEVEEVILSHPVVQEAAVIGVPDDVWGETVKAIIVLKEGRTATAEEIIELCRGRLASYKKPKTVDFVKVLPRNVAGKVLKRELKKLYSRA